MGNAGFISSTVVRHPYKKDITKDPNLENPGGDLSVLSETCRLTVCTQLQYSIEPNTPY